MKLDKIDLKILKILQQKGKITNVQLSNQVGLSPGPTLERVRKLESSGIIKNYHARLDLNKIGLGFTALINLSLGRQKENTIMNFKKAISEIDEVVECYQLTGNYDYQLKVVVKDIPSFEALIADKLSKIEEIGSMQTMVVLSELKQNSVVPLDYSLDIYEIK